MKRSFIRPASSVRVLSDRHPARTRRCFYQRSQVSFSRAETFMPPPHPPSSTKRFRFIAGTKSRSTRAVSITRPSLPVIPASFGEQLGPRPVQPRHGHRAYRDVRHDQCRRASLPQLYRRSTRRSIRSRSSAAISQAAHDTLVALYPSQTMAFQRASGRRSGAVHNNRTKERTALTWASAWLPPSSRMRLERWLPNSRTASLESDWITSNQPGHWRQDPISLIPLALGAHWGECLSVRSAIESPVSLSVPRRP